MTGEQVLANNIYQERLFTLSLTLPRDRGSDTLMAVKLPAHASRITQPQQANPSNADYRQR